MSERRLQRRLDEVELGFEQLLNDYRRQEAQRLLTDDDQSIAHIAYTLGFSEQSSFSRAFKRWTGKAPAEWRAEQ